MIVAAIAVLCALIFAVLLALRRPDTLTDRYDLELATHKKSLAGLEADAAAGHISDATRSALSLDVQRRMLRLQRNPQRVSQPSGPLLPLLVVLACLGLGVAGYARFGHAALPDVAASAPPAPAAAHTSFQNAQAALLTDPGNIPAWIDMSVALMEQGQTAQAVEALTMAARHMPGSADLQVALGQALMMHGGGQLSPAARLAFDRAAAIDPAHPGPRLYLALAWIQAGQPQQALPLLEALDRESPADAPWRPRLARMLRGVHAMMAAGVGTAAAPR